ncbi:MAG: hypothetical protein V1855_02520 [bacterium]
MKKIVILSIFLNFFYPQHSNQLYASGELAIPQEEILYSAAIGLTSAIITNIGLSYAQKGPLIKIIITPSVAITVFLAAYLVLHSYYTHAREQTILGKKKHTELRTLIQELEEQGLKENRMINIDDLDKAYKLLQSLLQLEKDKFSRLILGSLQKRLDALQQQLEKKPC